MCKTYVGYYILLLFLESNTQQIETNVTTDANVTATPKEDVLRDYGWDVWCKLQPNGYDCNGKGFTSSRFYYDLKMEDCKTFTFGQCPRDKNHFNTLKECQQQCRDSGFHTIKGNLSQKISCRLQPDFGKCNDYYPMWYFDLSVRACKGFSYSGCGGNSNRFATAQICTGTCSSIVDY
ncbi:kunitz-type serine protease inhibitor A-like [Achroia grisella]|uniref:kunitz-type serine protease inhibitor A-like n=1 Tax=Achroia grisella TaxID=688607 RepID=UPI0027D34E3F|nr:kunitz-type serine protease inhibitor A-like [Achroia grisella]